MIRRAGDDPGLTSIGREDPIPDSTAMARDRDEALSRIEAALRGLRFGTVTATVQDGVVVQVERTERVRVVRSARWTGRQKGGV
jgi:hypothetical protein